MIGGGRAGSLRPRLRAAEAMSPPRPEKLNWGLPLSPWVRKTAAATGSFASSTDQVSATTTLDNVNAAVNSSLEYLKEQLFRLELRHQAGTISDEEYATERARAEKVLRDLVRG